MDDLKNILGRILKKTPNFKEHELKVRIFEAWERVVGERVAKQCWPLHLLNDGTLLIGAESSAWLNSLRYLEAQIVEKYEKELGSRIVKQLRFKLEGRKPF